MGQRCDWRRDSVDLVGGTALYSIGGIGGMVLVVKSWRNQ